MAFKIPSQENRVYRQDNYSDIYGDVWSTFNIDFSYTRGKALPTRGKLVLSSTTNDDLEIVSEFTVHDGILFALTEKRVFITSADSPEDLAIDSSFNDLTAENTTWKYNDMENFNGELAVIGDEDVYSYNNDSGWTKEIDAGLTNDTPHITQSYANRLYITDNHDQVISLSTAYALATTGSNTLDLGLNSTITDYTITMLEAGENGLWIGLMALNGGKGLVYFWDGENENTTSRRFTLNSSGVVAGTILDSEQVPVFVDTAGRLMKFNGAGFDEVARFPLNGANLRRLKETDNERAIHPNGMKEVDGKVMILINSRLAGDGGRLAGGIAQRMPSGIWEYTEENGLYHKYSPSLSNLSDTGTTNLSDYGQQVIGSVGAIFSTVAVTSNKEESGIIFSAQYDNYDEVFDINTEYGIFTDDTDRTTQALGYIITPQLFSGEISDTWQYVYSRFKKLVTASDKIIIKARTDWTDALEFDTNWLDTTTLTTTDDMSSAEVGDEVEVLQQNGSGCMAQITSISKSASTYTIGLDDAVLGVSNGDTGRARLTKFKKIGEFSNQYADYYKAPITHSGTWIQLKIVFIGTGDNEFYDLTVVNSGNIEI